MKNFIGLLFIGVLIRNGLADVSHLSQHNHNGYLPPKPAHNLFIEQDNNGINSPHDVHHSHQQYQSGGDNGDRGYLPPHQDHSAHHHHHHDHQHEHHQHSHQHQEDRGYLPPPQMNTQEHSHTHVNNQQVVDSNNGYLPPVQGQELHENHNHQDDRGYLPPYKQQQFESHDHHQNTHQHKQDPVDPSLQVSYYNNYAVSLQHDGANHDHSKESNSIDTYEDNSNGYNYSPPSKGFEEAHQHHHHHVQQSDNLVGGPQSSMNVVPTSQNGFQQEAHHEHHEHHHHSSEETHSHSHHEHATEDHHQHSNRDYLPPIPSSHGQISTHTNQVEQVKNFQSHETEESYHEDERGYLPPIGALELPKSSDSLHIVPPSTLGLPVEKKNQQGEIDHINVPLPIPQVGYYFIPAVMTELPSLTETKSEHITSTNSHSAIENHQQPQYQQYQEQQQVSTQSEEIEPALDHFTSSDIRIIPSIQTAQEISSQGYLTPSQVISHHDQDHYADIDFSLPNDGSNHIEVSQHNFPPITQIQQEQDQFVNHQQFDQNQNTVQQNTQVQSSFEHFAKSAVHGSGVSNQHNHNQISGSLVQNNHQNNGYLPPIPNHHHQHQHQTPQSNDVYSNNQVTNLQTYMDNVNPNDSKPTAVEAYAPGMSYKSSTNAPFNPAGYLPPTGNAKSQQTHEHEYSPSIGYELNEQDKKDLALQPPRTMLPIADILGHDMSQLMKQLQGQIRTIQITDHHDHSVKNIKVLDSANQAGERTIEILGHSHEVPMGDHKVLHVISKNPNPEVVHQTIKIFNDSKEVSKPSKANNDYLPPPPSSNADPNNRNKFRRSF